MSTVDQANPDTAALMRRVFRRTLTVVGGSIAGTAIAWAISSASASAEAPCEAPRLDAVSGLSQVVDGEIAQQVGPLVGVGPGFSEPVSTPSTVVCAVGQVVPLSPITDLGSGARRAADDVGRTITGQFGWIPTVPIDLGGLGRGDRPGADTAPGGGTHEPPSLVWPVGEQSAAAPASSILQGVDQDRLAAGTATERALGDGLTRRGSPAPIAPGKPAPTPGAPATMPGTGSSGHTGGGADSPAFAALSQTGSNAGLTRGRAIAGSQVRMHGEQGAQPGVTPD
jgi:hypothetical protein